jgi:hypothetical protein
MPDTVVQEYIDTPAARTELVAYLTQGVGAGLDESGWRRRLSHWWDENPCACMHPHRGYVARHGEKMVGYAGAIPSSYTLKGLEVPALLATTLRVDAGHAKAGLHFLLKMRRLGRQVLIAHTTPVRRLQQLLAEMGAHFETRMSRRVLPLGRLAGLLPGRFRWPVLEASVQRATCLGGIKRLAVSPQRREMLEKTVSLELLRWQMDSPQQRLRFLGAVDSSGCLQSFLLLRQSRLLRVLSSWEIVQSWTARETVEELWALVAELIREPGILGARLNWLAATSFAADFHWRGLPCLLEHPERVCHYFLMPQELRRVAKHSMLAEGDLML